MAYGGGAWGGSASKTLVGSAAETISVSDAVTTGVSARATETVTVSDAASRTSMAFLPPVSEPAITVGDSAIGGIGHLVSASETILISDAVTRFTFIVGSALVVREKMPLRLHVRVTTPDGHSNRWSPDAFERENVLMTETHSKVMPGGMENFTAELPRDGRLSYPDLEELSHIRVEGVGGDVAWEGRLTKIPRDNQDAAKVTATGVGYQDALQDNNGAAVIYVDRSFANWIPASVQRKINLLNGGFGSVGDPSNQADQTTGNPAEKLSVTGAWSQEVVAEAWYDGKGLPIAQLFFSVYGDPQLGAMPVANGWQGDAGLSSDDVASAFDDGAFHDIGAGYANSVYASDFRSWAFLQLINSAAGGVQGVEYGMYAGVLAVYGVTGVPLRGPYDASGALGVLASDVCAHAVNFWAGEMAVDVEDSSFVIPQLVFLDRTNAADIIKQACRFELLDWWVDVGPTFKVRRRDAHGRKWRARAWPSKLSETGKSTERLWNGVVIQYTDDVGMTRTVGPPGSNANVEDARLADPDPTNPANQAGITKWQGLKMGTSTASGATQVGVSYLTAQKELDHSGQAQLAGWVEDAYTGVFWPAWKVDAGDWVAFTGTADESYRKVVHTAWDDSTKVNTVQLDQPPDALQALLERLSVAIAPLGFT